ncbi:MAG TPA: ABC transporter transmembrane domain-containing protein [Sphingorhabdus sp.]|uniref:ABC transporter transmembrane domain-containing protein n=1 Tax=Sphingorhabdus sp. TaxID=1902408 RepID=UPI002C1CFF34|nr:ABC transporter transmembrane domain-containing protein [Sphingorhabdus sp.]HMT41984.1 ABC transporter transmembrane domain-containing protein [Sphingorhabdus sp.]HMU21367.1 ABC transporter transmembrane domain-containing protein [Sphingorhabdus sp.]
MIASFTIAYPRQILFALLALIFAASSTLAIPFGLRLIIDKGFVKNGGDPAPYFFLLFGIVAIIGISTAFRFYFVSWLGERVVGDIRAAVQNNLLRLAPRFFEENRPAEIASRMTADTAIIEQIVGTTVSVALRNLFIGIGGVILLFSLAPSLTIWLLAGIPIVVLPIVFLGRRLEKASRSSQDKVAGVGTVASEALGAIKIVQAFGQEQREQQRFRDAVESTFAAAKRRIRLRAFLTALVMTLIFGGITLLVWEGTDQVTQGIISAGTLFAVVLYGGLVAGSFGALTEVYGDLVRASGASARLAELLNEVPEIAAPANPVTMPAPRGQIEFQNVKFRYPTRPEVAALSDFSLKILPGETVAVVGPSGAGKSTLFQLAQRFYDPEAGTVRIDGVALTSADPAEFRQRMALVPQDTVLFAASARDNLRYGNWLADDVAIWAAAEQANAGNFLRELPQGLDTYLGEGGARLSGGQRQRIAIARALLRDAPILLLDEATSALDAESERLVQDALEHLMEGRTTIVIAHRLATVRKADRIIVMDEGRIVEEGTHDSLSKAGGLYARLASLQFDA